MSLRLASDMPSVTKASSRICSGVTTRLSASLRPEASEAFHMSMESGDVARCFPHPTIETPALGTHYLDAVRRHDDSAPFRSVHCGRISGAPARTHKSHHTDTP